MKTYRFTVKEHEEFGSLGFAPKWYPNGDPLSGMAVPHDIFEHFNKDEGGAEGEFMALGACYLIRGETGYMQRNGNVNPPHSHLAADFPEIFGHTIEQRGSYDIRTCEKKVKIPDHIREVFILIKQEVITELECREDQELIDAMNDQAEIILKWFAYGYLRAKKRYAKINVHTLAYEVFDYIETQANKLLNGAEEGMELVVKVMLNEYNAEVKLIDPRDRYY